LGSLYLIKKILPHFKKNNSGKIIQFSGGGASSTFPFFSPYSISKTAIVRFVENLSKEIEGSNIAINAIAPGPVNTRMLDEVLDSGPDKVGKIFYEKSLLQKKKGGTDIKKIIDLVEFLILANSSDISGKLISALWDNWKIFKKKKMILKNSDFGTLRRIAGRDRKLNFFDK
jgi:NAD(P)-dependent dehydrogenase (short-subunit alcohol dehydrogenase family)